MRTFLAILRFELALYLRSPMSWVLLALYFAIHLLTAAGIGIHINDNQLILIDSPYMIVQTELVLGVFGLVPAIYFVVNAATRDHERGTAALFFTTPVDKTTWLAGRFSAATLMAAAAGTVGVAGTLAGAMLPGLDPVRLGPFAWSSYAATLVVLVLPNIVVFSALFFGVAALTRSVALSFALALGVLVLEIVLNAQSTQPHATWLLWLEPFGGLAVAEMRRYWTIAELNTQLPLGLLTPNRILWLAIGAGVLAVTMWRYRLDLSHETSGGSWLGHARRFISARLARRAHSSSERALRAIPVVPVSTAGPRPWRQLGSQLRMDVRAVALSPLFWLVLLLSAVATISEIQSTVSSLNDLPLHPTTSRVVGIFRYNQLQFVLLIVIFYAGALVHREREHDVADLVDATPCPDWVPVVSKTLALCAVITLLIATALFTSIAMQLVAGSTRIEPRVYLQSFFVYDGFSFYMLAVLAVFLQVLSAGKWSGMLLVLGVVVALLSLEPLGYEHVLYGFRIPPAVYSDMNGYGPFRRATFSLIVYWGAFCVVLVVAGHLLFPRGRYARVAERLRDARTRWTRPTALTAIVAASTFAAAGTSLFYNTNVLNAYETNDNRSRVQADYERRYSRWAQADAPSFQDISLEVDLYPAETRLDSRGTAVLRNNRPRAIGEFVITVDPRMQVRRLEVDRHEAAIVDSRQGVFVFRVDPPLPTGATVTVSWDMARGARGFVNSAPDVEIVENGTYIDSTAIMPIPGYDESRALTDPSERRAQGLPPAPPVAALGDPAFLDTIGAGIDSHTNTRVVISTSDDQVAVASGALRREWQQEGRHYFEYVSERPVWPSLSLTSARYTVARDVWNGVSLEVYHDAKHPWNVPTMLDTAKKAFTYLSREFGPYPLSHFRILEYPKYPIGRAGVRGRGRLFRECRFPHGPSRLGRARLRHDPRAVAPVVGRQGVRRPDAGAADAQRDDGAVLDLHGVQGVRTPRLDSTPAHDDARQLPAAARRGHACRATTRAHRGSGQHLVQQRSAGHVRAPGHRGRRSRQQRPARVPRQVRLQGRAVSNVARPRRRPSRGDRPRASTAHHRPVREDRRLRRPHARRDGGTGGRRIRRHDGDVGETV
ncbi:MAG: ABC transporter permease subunit [Vicinamibacterales bacterium]